MFSKRQGEEKQEEFWIERGRVSKPSSQGFYSKLNEHLAAMDFARQVWASVKITASGREPIFVLSDQHEENKDDGEDKHLPRRAH
jgi:hypothetical protein